MRTAAAITLFLLLAFPAFSLAKKAKKFDFRKTVEKLVSKEDAIVAEGREEIALILTEWGKKRKEVIGVLKKSGGSPELYRVIVEALAANIEDPGAILKEISDLKQEPFFHEVLKGYKRFKKGFEVREILFTAAGKYSEEYDISLLIFIDDNRMSDATDILLKFLGGRTLQIREYAARLLKDFGVRNIQEPLIKTLSFEISAFDAGKAGFLKLILDLLAMQGTDDALSTIVATMKYTNLSEHGCSKLLEVGDTSITYLVLTLKAGDPERSEAVKTCLRRFGSRAVKGVSELLTNPSEEVRMFALTFVSENRTPEIVPELVRLYKEGKPFPKDNILRLLTNFEVRYYESFIEELLHSDSAEERINGLSLLEKRCETGYRKKIISMLEEDENISVREKAAEVVFHIGLKDAVPVMERMAQYEEENFALKLTHYLAFLGGTDTADIMKEIRRTKKVKLGEAARLALEILTYSTEKEEFEYEKPRDFKGGEIKLALDEFGVGVRVTGKGKAFFVIPGGPDFGIESIFPFFDGLASKYSVIYVDPTEVRRNFKSADIFAEEARSIHKMKEKLGISEIIIAAHDTAALPAIKYAMLYPDMVKALLLINPQFPDRKSFDEAEASYYARLSPHFQEAMKGIIEKQADFCSDTLSEYYFRLAAAGYAGGNDNPLELLVIQGDLKMREQYLSHIGNYSLSESIANLKPFLGIIFSEHSTVTPEQKVMWKKAIELRGKGRGEIKTLSGCGHFPQITCGKSLIKVMKDMVED